jgi:hypothetical protein
MWKKKISGKKTTAARASKKKLAKIKILKSPSGQFLLPYNVGQTVEIDPEQAKELIEGGFAEKA